MSIKIGTSSIDDIKLGSTQVDKVMLNGKNLYNIPDGTSSTSGGTYWTRSGNTITGHGTRNTATNFQPVMDFTNFDTPIPAGTYTVSLSNAAPLALELHFRDSNGTEVISSSTAARNLPAGQTSKTVTISGTAVDYRIICLGLSNGTSIEGVQFKDLMLESGSSATPYEPFIGEVTLWQKTN